MKTEMDDHALIERYKQGDELAFELLVRRYQKPLYEFVVRNMRDADEAAEIAQQTFVQVFLKMDQFKGESSFKTWLYQVAINLIRNHSRSQHSSRLQTATEAELNEVPDQETVTGRFFVNEQSSILRQAIESLPEKQKMTLILRVYQELKFEEIAEIMMSSLGTSKANYHHAVGALRKWMQENQLSASNAL